jgi:hypothetical protein
MAPTIKPNDGDTEKSTVTLPGTVEKIIPSMDTSEPDKAQIAVEGAEPLYKEIRIENVLKNGQGEDVSLKPGADVEVTIAADPESIEDPKGKAAKAR